MPAKYRVGVIGDTGRGNYGHGIDRVWLELPQTEIVAVADRDETGRTDAVKRLGAAKAFADYRQMLDEVRPDIVSICPRWLDQHRDMVVAAAERGVHIYMEKPMCRSLTEADEMVAACEKRNVKLAIAFQTRYSPKLPVMRNMIEDGLIGNVLELRGRGKEDRRGGGEDLWVLGSHVMNLMHYFAGQPNWCFSRVLQQGNPITKADVAPGAEGIGPLAGDTINATYGMDEGVTACFASHRETGAGRPSRFGVQIFGSRGVLEILTGFLPEVYYLDDKSWSPGRSGSKWVPVTSEGLGQDEPLNFDHPLHPGNAAACRDLIAAIEEDRQPEANIYEARTTVEMIAAAFESQRVGGMMPLPLKNRENPLSIF